MSQPKEVPTIRFDASLYTIVERTILRLPQKASEKLPSRGQVALGGTTNGHAFHAVLEPDGHSGHWMRIDEKQQPAADVRVTTTIRAGAGMTAWIRLGPRSNGDAYSKQQIAQLRDAADAVVEVLAEQPTGA